jgi:hypothetical protein
MLDSDLANLYNVATGALNRAVKRNAERFPQDFMFQLTREEAECLRCQTGISNDTRGGRRYLPFAFTELLISPRAVQMNIAIMRTFVHLRQVMAENRELERRIASFELQQREHASIISAVVEEIQDLRQHPEPPRRRIGF